MTQGTPRYLLGLGILFWVTITEHIVPGIICLALIEGAHWTRVRWAFGEKASLVAWRLSVLFLTMAMALVLLQGGSRLTAMSRVFIWLPVILLPLQFVQSYGTSPTLSLSTFSMMVRRRRAHALEYGLPYRDIRFAFGNVYLCGTLLACSLDRSANAPWFYAGLLLLVSWGLVAAGWKTWGTATVLALVLSGLGGFGGQKGLTALYNYVTMGHMSQDSDPQLNHARERTTSIGDLGNLKQSPEIVWRLILEKGPVPRLLRVASYNTYSGTMWLTTLPKGRSSDTADFEALPELGNPANLEDPEDKFQICPPALPNQSVAIDPFLARFRIRGVISDRGGLLPLPANAASLHRFAFEELERNSFGTFMMKPSQPVSDARVLWGEQFATEAPPWESIDRGLKPIQPDLTVPLKEATIVREVVEDLKLREGSTVQKIERLREHFLRNFKYSRYNSVPKDLRSWAKNDPERAAWVAKGDRTLIGAFLQFSHTGHCEYFATSAALLLRETGVPTRYVSGFAVAEFDREKKEAVIRGTHAHAWCRAWDVDSGKWIDVDLTPPDWTGMETPRMSRFQGLQDRLQRMREDLLVWRDQPGHMAIITAVLLAPVLIGLAFMGRNLWRSRQQVEDARKKRRGPVVLANTPLSGLEKPARKILGERPPGLPLGPWLLQLSPRLRDPGVLVEAVQLHQKLRFDPGLTDAELAGRLGLLVAELRKQFREPLRG